MAIKYTLNENKLEEFENFLKDKGYCKIPLSQNGYEAMRMRKGKDTIILYRKANSGKFLTVSDKDIPIVEEFMSVENMTNLTICENCFHGEVCYLSIKEDCEFFKDRARIIELPCAVGETVYKICPQSKHIKMGQMWDGRIVEHECQMCPWEATTCHDIGFQKDLNNIVREINCKSHAHALLIKEYFGKNFFSSREEAEKEIERLRC